jgi:hypothetical protein
VNLSVAEVGSLFIQLHLPTQLENAPCLYNHPYWQKAIWLFVALKICFTTTHTSSKMYNACTTTHTGKKPLAFCSSKNMFVKTYF